MVAQVSDETREHIEELLDECSEEWARLPEVEREIAVWDETRALTYLAEWPLHEQHLRMLEAYAADGALTPDERQRLDRLEQLARRHRPIAQRLRGG